MYNFFNKIMKPNLFTKLVTLSLLFQLFAFSSFAQNDSTTVVEEKPKKDKRPIKETFECGYLLNNQTIKVPTKNTLEFIIQHRFGKLNSEEFDLLGLYAPSNIRIGLNYTFTDNLQIGIGTTKNNKLQDLGWKYAILKQTRSGSIPLSITYFGDAAIDLRKDVFPKRTNSLSYFHQLIIARKINTKLSLEVAPSLSHFNMVDSLVAHNNIGLSFNGRYKIGDATAIIFEYDHNFTKPDSKLKTAGTILAKPNLSIGLEASTGSHVFQVFVGTYDYIINQYSVLYNASDFTKKDVLIGFNVTRLWNY